MKNFNFVFNLEKHMFLIFNSQTLINKTENIFFKIFYKTISSIFMHKLVKESSIKYLKKQHEQFLSIIEILKRKI